MVGTVKEGGGIERKRCVRYCKRRRKMKAKVRGRYCKRRRKIKEKSVVGTAKGGEMRKQSNW